MNNFNEIFNVDPLESTPEEMNKSAYYPISFYLFAIINGSSP